jgi:hypothetical protein
MRPWKEIITEAKDKKNMTAAEIRKAGEAALKDEQTKNKKEKQAQAQKSKNKYYKLAKKREKRKGEQLKFSIDQARKNAEARKNKELEDIKNKPRQAASAALSDIKTQSISQRDSDATAYTKVVGNVSSLAGGIAKAGIGYAVAKHKAKKAAAEAEKNDVESKIPKKKPRKSGLLGGRPPSGGQTPPSGGSPTPPSGPNRPKPPAGPKGQEAKPTKRVVHKAPTIYGFPVGNQARSIALAGKTISGKFSTIGRGGENALSRRIDKANKVKRPYKGNASNIKEKYSNWRDELLIEQGLLFEVEDETNKTDKTEKKKIIDVMRGKNKIEINPTMKEEKDQEGGMAHNELATMERAVKTLRKKIKSPNQQLPAWVQSKISKAADYIDTVSDYMSGETEPVTEECGCEDDEKKVLAMMIIRKAVDAKKKKNFQLNSGIIGEEKTAAWQRKEGKNPEGGLNKKGIASYRRENPGSKLSMAVTTPPSKLDPDSKAAKRRKSFCARMGGMPGPMKDEKGRPTRKALSLRKWNC